MTKKQFSISNEIVIEAESSREAKEKFIEWIDKGGSLDNDVYIEYIGKDN